MYEIHISDKTYLEWNLNPNPTNPTNPTNPNRENLENPFSHKLFHKDTFSFVEDRIEIIHSPTRNSEFLTGILILEQNRTYGRTPNKKKLYYSCIPNQKQLPIFLIPYEIQLGFQKNIQNKYVLFKFDHWEKNDKHPYGILTQTIGNVNHLPHYYEYQLYVKNIHPSSIVSKYNKQIRENISFVYLNTHIQDILSNPKDYGTIHSIPRFFKIFTIDPPGCVDRDDALAIIPMNQNIFRVHVFIANIWVWIHKFQLWDLIEHTNISTIYLPDFNRNMLPTELSEKICSLDIGETPRFTFSMEFEINISDKTCKPIYNPDILTQTCIYISKNFDYESESLLKYSSYNLLLQVTREIHPEIKDSHELVAFWMMQMNTFIAKEMYSKQIGIFRITQNPNTTNPTNPTNPINPFIHLWEQAISGKYISFKTNTTDYSHSVLNVSHYMHFTSPIRRKVDIYNQLYWISSFLSIPDIQIKLPHINEDTTKIRKLQNECTLLSNLNNQNQNQINNIDGILLQITPKILVYLPIFKCILTCKTTAQDKIQDLDLYTTVKCSVFIFERESDYKRKIRVEID